MGRGSYGLASPVRRKTHLLVVRPPAWLPATPPPHFSLRPISLPLAVLMVAFAVLQLMLFASPGSAQQETWLSPRGPHGGYAIAVAADAEGRVFAGDGNGHVFRSTDGGATWEQVGSTPSSLACLATASSALYAGTWTGVEVSTDHGETWVPTALTVPVNAIAFGASGLLFASSYFDGVYRSADGGQSWTPLGLLHLQALAVAPDGLVLVGTNGGILRSEDHLDSWIYANLPQSQVWSLASDAAGRLYAGTNRGVFRSLNRGVDWELTLHDWYEFSPPVFSVAVAPNGHVFAGTNYQAGIFRGAWRSTDGSATWVRIREDGGSPLCVDPSGHLFASRSDGEGLSRSLDEGDTWEALPLPNTYVTALAATRLGTTFAATTIDVFRTLDRGETWQRTGLVPYVASLVAAPGGDVFAVAGGNAYRTSDGGEHWSETPVEQPGVSLELTSVVVASDGGLLAGGRRGMPPCFCGFGVYRSMDLGATWTHTGLLAEILSLGVAPGAPLMAGSCGAVYLSLDDGATWTRSDVGLPAGQNVRAVAAAPAGAMYAGTGSGLFQSLDQGATWTPTSLAQEVVTLVVDASGQIFAGGSAGVFASHDGGATWSALESGLRNLAVSSLALDDLGYAYAGTQGSGVARSAAALGSPTTGSGDRDLGRTRLLSITGAYGGDAVEIKFAVAGSTLPVDLGIFDVRGRLIRSLLQEGRPQGEHTTTWDRRTQSGGRVARGVFIVRLRASGTNDTRKLVLLGPH